MYLTKDPINRGYQAEKVFYEYISNVRICQKILHECELRKCHDWHMASIDYLLFLENGIVPVQIKYRGSRRRENTSVNNFLNAVNRLHMLYNKPILFGIWISRLRPFEDNQERLKSQKILCVDYFHDMNTLMKNAVDCIIANL